MVNTDYRIEAIGLLLREECVLQGYWPLIPSRDTLVRELLRMGCRRKSDAQALPDEALLQAGLAEETLGLFRKFLALYDIRPQKMREIPAVSRTPEEEAAFRELYLLPGVKSTRARLYLRAGFGTLQAVAETTADVLTAACRELISREELKEKPPLPKEALTHIVVARAFTDRLKETKNELEVPL